MSVMGPRVGHRPARADVAELTFVTPRCSGTCSMAQGHCEVVMGASVPSGTMTARPPLARTISMTSLTISPMTSGCSTSSARTRPLMGVDPGWVRVVLLDHDERAAAFVRRGPRLVDPERAAAGPGRPVQLGDRFLLTPIEHVGDRRPDDVGKLGRRAALERAGGSVHDVSAVARVPTKQRQPPIRRRRRGAASCHTGVRPTRPRPRADIGAGGHRALLTGRHRTGASRRRSHRRRAVGSHLR